MTIRSSSETVRTHIADHVAMSCEEFQNFVTTWTQLEGVKEKEISLEELLAAWLYVGMGIESTAASYDHFLQVVLRIIDGVLKGMICLDYDGRATAPFPRRLVGLTDPKLGGNVLSRMGYDQLVHQTLEGRRSEELSAELHGILRALKTPIHQPETKAGRRREGERPGAPG